MARIKFWFCLSVLLFFLPASHLDPLRNLISDCKAHIVHSDYHAVPSVLEYIDGTSLPDVMLMHKLHDLGIAEHPFNRTDSTCLNL